MGPAKSGLRRMASRYSATASSGLPSRKRTLPRLVGLGEVGLEADGLAVLGLGGGIVVLAIAQDRPEAAVGLGVVGFEPDRRAEFGDGLVRFALAMQGIAEVGGGPRRSRA